MSSIFNIFNPKPEPSYLESAQKFVSDGIQTASDKVAEAAAPVKKFMESCVAEGTWGGDIYNATSSFAKSNATTLGYSGALVGGFAVTNSALNLLQKGTNDPAKVPSRARELTKILVGSGLIAASVAYAAKDSLERSMFVNAAIGAGLLTAAARAISVTKPTYLVFQLKTKEKQSNI